MDPKIKELILRNLKGIGGFAKSMRADNLRSKYSPKAPPDLTHDGADEAAAQAHLPSVGDVKAQMAGDASMQALKNQADPNQALADETLSGNQKALQGLDPEKLKEILASLGKK